MANKISLHHIGGRSGSRAFPILKAFEKDMVSVFYDADKDCIEQIKENNLRFGSELYVLPYCLGRTNGKAEFNLNYDPYTNSLLKPNDNMGQYYCFYKRYDYVFEEVLKTMESFQIEISTLDSALINKNDIPKPDFLSIDTQGSEYDILLGAKELLNGHILGLVLEVEFKQLYKDQPLFCEIEKLLSSQGFDFIKFLSLYELSAYRAPVGLRAEGEHSFADVLFLKRDNTIIGQTVQDYVKLRKLAFLSIAFNQLERGLLYLSKSKEIKISQEIQSQLAKYSYFRFLDEFDCQVSLVKKQYPATFAQLYTFEKSKSRFDNAAQKANRKVNIYSKIINVIKKNGKLYEALWTTRDSLKNSFKKSINWLNFTVRFYFSSNTSLESLLRKYELRGLAKKVKFNRLYQSLHSKLKSNK